MSTEFDAVIVGGGHNGLCNAAFLAKAGLKVVVLERNAYVGGAAVSRELHEGWIYSNCSYVCSLLRPEIYRELELARHGLQVIPYGGGVTLLRNGDILGTYLDPEVKHREFARHNKRDADAYIRFSRDVMRQCRFIRGLLLRTPPDPTSFRPRDLGELLHVMKRFYGLGESVMYDTMRFYTLSVGDYLDEYFESPLIKGHLAGSGIIGTALGPYSPGTAYVLLHHYMGDVDGNHGAWGFARGGMGAVSNALAGAVKQHGGEIRTDAEVAQILADGDRVKGVVLTSGEEVRAKTVVSNLDVKRTYLSLMDDQQIDPYVVRMARNFRIRGSSGKLNIALESLPHFTALGDDHELLSSDMHFLEDIQAVERAYDDWKDGRWSREPYLDMLIPTMTDPTMAPPGKHFMSVFVQYVPHVLADGDWTDAKRAEFGQTVMDQIGQYSPDFKDLIAHAEIRTPHELEAEVGLTEGNIFQGELTLDQLLFNRPFPGYAQYRGPIKGMYMCGSSTHPGGGVMAAPGANAAREIIRDLRLKSSVPTDYSDD